LTSGGIIEAKLFFLTIILLLQYFVEDVSSYLQGKYNQTVLQMH